MITRKFSLNIHKSDQNKVIKQLDGSDSSCNEVYPEYYWKRDQLGTWPQSYLDVNENIESAIISNKDKSNKTKRAFKAREDVFVKLGQTVESSTVDGRLGVSLYHWCINYKQEDYVQIKLSP